MALSALQMALQQAGYAAPDAPDASLTPPSGRPDPLGILAAPTPAAAPPRATLPAPPPSTGPGDAPDPLGILGPGPKGTGPGLMESADIGGSLYRSGAMLAMPVAGFMQAAGEYTGDPALAEQGRFASEAFRDLYQDSAAQSLAQRGEGWIGKPGYYVSKGVETILGNFAPMIVAGFVGGPNASMATLMLQSYGTTYADKRASGRTPTQASMDAAYYALAEAIPERIPLGIAFKGGAKGVAPYLRRILKTAGAEGATEMLTQALQDGYDAGVIGDDITLPQAIRNLVDAGILGFGAGGVMGAVTHAAAGNRPPAHHRVGRQPIDEMVRDHIESAAAQAEQEAQQAESALAGATTSPGATQGEDAPPTAPMGPAAPGVILPRPVPDEALSELDALDQQRQRDVAIDSARGAPSDVRSMIEAAFAQREAERAQQEAAQRERDRREAEYQREMQRGEQAGYGAAALPPSSAMADALRAAGAARDTGQSDARPDLLNILPPAPAAPPASQGPAPAATGGPASPPVAAGGVGQADTGEAVQLDTPTPAVPSGPTPARVQTPPPRLSEIEPTPPPDRLPTAQDRAARQEWQRQRDEEKRFEQALARGQKLDAQALKEADDAAREDYRRAFREAWYGQEFMPETDAQQLGLTRALKELERRAERSKKASETARKRLRTGSDLIDPAKDDLLAAIAQAGGISREAAKAEGIDPAEFGRAGKGLLRVFTADGETLDGMARLLDEHGYPVRNSRGEYEGNLLLDALTRALGGEAVRSATGYEDAAASEVARREAEAEAEQARTDEEATAALRGDSPLNSPAFVQRVARVISDDNVEALGVWDEQGDSGWTVDVGSTETTITRRRALRGRAARGAKRAWREGKATVPTADLLAALPEAKREMVDEALARLQADSAPADEAANDVTLDGGRRSAEPLFSRRREGSGERPALDLTQPTPDTLRQRDAEREAADKAEAKRQREAEQKAAADREARDFELTGSDRPTDATPRQRTLFSRADAVTEQVASLRESIRADLGVNVRLFERGGDIEIVHIATPKDQRQRGLGTQAMERIIALADRLGRRLILTPGVRDAAFGTTSRARLVRWYKRLGFVENKGRRKDYAISAGMYRNPAGERARFNRANPAALRGQPRTTTSARPSNPANAALDTLRTELGAYFGADIPAGALAPARLSDADAEAVERIGRTFGKRVVIFENTRPDLIPPFNGVVLPSDPGTIYVDVDADSHVLAVVGHELTHHLRAEQPMLYDAVRRVAVGEMQDMRAYKAWLDSAMLSERGKPATLDEMEEEAIADYIGTQFADPSFWRRLEAREPTIFRRLATAVRDFLDAVLRRMTLRGLKGSNHFRDTETLRETVAAALTDYARRQMRASEARREGRVVASRADVGFYSALEHVAAAKLPGKGTGKSMAEAIEAFARKGQVKPEELEWVPVVEWLRSKGDAKVDRDEVVRFIRENRVRVETVVRGGGEQEYVAWYGGMELGIGPTREEAMRDAVEQYERAGGTYGKEPGQALSRDALEMALDIERRSSDGSEAAKFSDYTLPGGENYREVLLTVPVKPPRDETVPAPEVSAKYMDEWNALKAEFDRNRTPGPERDAIEAKMDALHARMVDETRALPRGGGTEEAFTGSHWDQPNVVAHLRTTERTDADGRRVLFVEEIQSDLHQEGRKKGYKRSDSKPWVVFDVREGRGDVARFATEREARERIESTSGGRLYLDYRHEADDGAVPDAPFKKAWPTLAMKQALRMAVEGGYDAVAWTTGAQQAERYRLSKHVSEVIYIPGYERNGDGRLMAYSADDSKVITETVAADKLADYIGKEVAERLLATPLRNGLGKPGVGENIKGHTLSGLDLNVGGEGMIAFYDRMLVNETNKLVKRYGAKVGEARVDLGGGRPTEYADFEAWQAAKNADAAVVHAFPVTDAMRREVLRGLPTFHRVTGDGGVRSSTGGARDGNTQGGNREPRRPGAGERGAEVVPRTVGGGPAAQGWASATRITRGGRPAAVHRAAHSPLGPQDFDPTRLGYASAHPSSGLGVFFGSTAGGVAQYGPIVERFHLDMRRPKVFKVEDLPGFDTLEDAQAFSRKLQGQGHDGIIVDASHVGGGFVFVAFRPEQVVVPAAERPKFSRRTEGPAPERGTAMGMAEERRLAERLRTLEEEVDAAYERGDLQQAEDLDAELAELRERFDSDVDLETDDIGEAGVEEQLVSAYADYQRIIDGDTPRSGYIGSDPAQMIEAMRAIIDEAGWSMGARDVRGNITDEQVLAAAKDAYEAARMRRAKAKFSRRRDADTRAVPGPFSKRHQPVALLVGRDADTGRVAATALKVGSDWLVEQGGRSTRVPSLKRARETMAGLDIEERRPGVRDAEAMAAQAADLARNDLRPAAEDGRAATEREARTRNPLKKAMDYLDSQGPVGTLPEKQAYLERRYRTLGQIAEVDSDVKALYAALRDAGDEAPVIYQYLTTKEAHPSMIKTEKLREAAVTAKKMLEASGRRLVERGLLDEATFEANKGAYLPRLYLKHLLDEGDFLALGSGKKPSDLGYLKRRKDIPESVRRLILGEITDPGFLASRGYGQQMRDVALLDWLHEIAGNDLWVLPRSRIRDGNRWVTPYWMKAEARRIRAQSIYYTDADQKQALALADAMELRADRHLAEYAEQVPDDFKQVPDSPRYGALRGLIVRREIYDDIVGARMLMPDDTSAAQLILGDGGLASKMTSLWKWPLALDTPLPTPDGWTTMGEVKVGDSLFDERGRVCRVLEVKEVLHGRECFEVAFSDGTKIVADKDHRWLVLNSVRDEKVLTTGQIKDTITTGPCGDHLFVPDAGVPVHHRQQSQLAPTIKARQIVAVTPVPSVPVRCIGVSSSSELFLAGEGFIPTHNSKVAANPPAQIRNFISNGVLLHLSGVPLHLVGTRLIQAISAVRSNNRYYQVAKKYGVTEATFAAQEIYRIERDLVDLEARRAGRWSFATIKRIAGVVMDFTGDMYQLSEAVWKTAKIIDAMERQGLDEGAAAMEAQKWLFDYSLVTPSMRYLRNAPVGIPFITFYFKALPRLIETAIRRPWAYAPYLAMPYILSQVIAGMADVDDDDVEALKKALPQWLQDRGHAYFLPIRDDKGRWTAMDFGYFYPWAMWTEILTQTAKGEFGDVLDTSGILGGPLPSIISAVQTNTDPFTRQPIINEYDTPARKVAALMNYLWTLSAPTWLTEHGFAVKLADAINGSVNRYGEPGLNELQATMRLVGVNLYPIDPVATRAANLRRMRFEIQEVKRRRSRLLRNRNLDAEERRGIADEYAQMIRKRMEAMQEYARESRVHPNLQ